MECLGSDGNYALWEVVDDHVVEEQNDHEDIWIWGFDFIFV